MEATAITNVFQPHQFAAGEEIIDLYHVYDNLSQTPYIPGVGIQCGDPDTYVMNAWHVITPSAMLKHLDWSNREPTQFISFYDDINKARRERDRRMAQGWVRDPPIGHPRIRNPCSVRIAHVQLRRGTNVWFFSRNELLNMMNYGIWNAAFDVLRVHGSE